MDDLLNELASLRATVTVLEEENATLSERAEDAMLLAQVAEAIENLAEPGEIIDQWLERVSILKNLRYVTCGQLKGCDLEHTGVYCSFSEDPLVGYPLAFNDELLDELQCGPALIRELRMVKGPLPGLFPSGGALVIPFHCHQYGACLFLACCRAGEVERLAQMVFLLDQVVRMVKARLDNLYLTRQLESLNSHLEERVNQKTRDLQKAHEEMRRTHHRLLTILQSIDSYIHVTDTRNYRLLFANNAAKKLFGDEVEGKECYRALRQIEQPCDFCRIPQLLAAADGPASSVSWESYNPKTGRWFFNNELLIDWQDAPKSLLTIGADITEIKQAEEEKQLLASKLHQAQKMEAIGVLAGSIAHDLNNILSGVVSYPDLLLTTVPADSPLRKGLTAIRAAGTRAAKIVQGLLTLSRRGLQVDEPVELGGLLKDYLESAECQDLLQKHPQVRMQGPFANEPLMIMGSPAHLSNVMMNLVMNAAEAMPGGGDIRIDLSKETVARQPHGFVSWRPGAYVRLSVSDTGIGIPNQHIERIFEPFFSLKEKGASGTGLGLAVVWGTVVDHRGHIDVESREGEGTTFTILLPLVDGVSETAQRSHQHQIKRGQGQSVLVIDDDPEQRRIASEILSYLGYRAMTSASGEAGVKTLQEQELDLVLLDMLMPPGMDGLDTYKQIISFRPEQRVIIVSGYSHSDRVKMAMDLGAACFLQKPYSLHNLSELIVEVLD